MPTGECIKGDFTIIATNPLVDNPTLSGIVPTSSVAQCCTKTTFFASTLDDADLKNDKTSALFVLSSSVSAAILSLQKADAAGDFADVTTLVDDTYGTFYALSFNTDDDARKYIGYKVDMRAVIIGFGVGSYRITAALTTIFGSKSIYSNDWCLKEWSASGIDGTVRIETRTNGIRGVATSQTDYIDFNALDWYNQTRLKGMFGFETSEFSREKVEYSNGQNEWITDEQTVKYILKLKPIDENTRDFLRVDVLQADEIIITDYNSKNAFTNIETYVNGDGSFEPRFNIKEALPVDISFVSAFNNLRKKRC